MTTGICKSNEHEGWVAAAKPTCPEVKQKRENPTTKPPARSSTLNWWPQRS